MAINPAGKQPISNMSNSSFLAAGKKILDSFKKREGIFDGLSPLSNEEGQAAYERRLKEKRTYVEAGGELGRNEVDISVALEKQYEKEAMRKVAYQKGSVTKFTKKTLSENISDIEKQERIEKYEEQTQNKIEQIEAEKQKNIALTRILGIKVNKRSLREDIFKGESGKLFSSFGGKYEQSVGKEIERELHGSGKAPGIKDVIAQYAREGKEIQRQDLPYYMKKAVAKQEEIQGTTFEKSKTEIISGAVLQLEKVANSTKGVSDQFKILDKELGISNKDTKDYSENLKKLGSGLSSTHNAAAMTLQSGAVVAGIIDNLKTGNIIGAASRGMSAGSMAAQTGRGLFSAGTAIAGAIGLGGAATTAMGAGALLGGSALIASVIPTIVGLTLASVAYKDADKYYKELGDYQKGIYGTRALSGGGGLPSRSDYNTYIKYGLQAGMTVPEYTQTALLLGSTGLMSRGEQKRSFTGANATGISDVAEISRTAMYLNRPVQELTNQIGSYLKATAGSTPGQMMNIMQSLAGGRMRGTMFTGELQNSIAGLSEMLMQSFGGVIKSVSSSSVSKILSPLMQAGITPSGAGNLFQGISGMVTNSFFNPQARLFLQHIGMTQESLLKGYRNVKDEKGNISRVTAYEDFMRNIGLSEKDMEEAGKPRKDGKKRKISDKLQGLLDITPEAGGDIGTAVALAGRNYMNLPVDQVNKLVALAEAQQKLVNSNITMEEWNKKAIDERKKAAAAEAERLKLLKETKGLESFNQRILDTKISIEGFLNGIKFGKDASIKLNAIKTETMHLLGNFGKEGKSFLDVINNALRGINKDIDKNEKPNFQSMFTSLMSGVGVAAAGAIGAALKDQKIIDATADGILAVFEALKERLFGEKAGEILTQESMSIAEKAEEGKYGKDIVPARMSTKPMKAAATIASQQRLLADSIDQYREDYMALGREKLLKLIKKTQKPEIYDEAERLFTEEKINKDKMDLFSKYIDQKWRGGGGDAGDFKTTLIEASGRHSGPTGIKRSGDPVKPNVFEKSTKNIQEELRYINKKQAEKLNPRASLGPINNESTTFLSVNLNQRPIMRAVTRTGSQITNSFDQDNVNFNVSATS